MSFPIVFHEPAIAFDNYRLGLALNYDKTVYEAVTRMKEVVNFKAIAAAFIKVRAEQQYF